MLLKKKDMIFRNKISTNPSSTAALDLDRELTWARRGAMYPESFLWMVFGPKEKELTFRSLFLGIIFACINLAVSMYFNYRYAGRLGQYC